MYMTTELALSAYKLSFLLTPGRLHRYIGNAPSLMPYSVSPMVKCHSCDLSNFDYSAIQREHYFQRHSFPLDFVRCWEILLNTARIGWSYKWLASDQNPGASNRLNITWEATENRNKKSRDFKRLSQQFSCKSRLGIDHWKCTTWYAFSGEGFQGSYRWTAPTSAPLITTNMKMRRMVCENVGP
jgi:hypothetical protein